MIIHKWFFLSTTGKKRSFVNMKYSVVIGLGANLGNREESIDSAIRAIQKHGEFVSRSSIYETSAWGYDSQNNYYNVCVELKTALEPVAFLDEILKIENELGRTRSHLGYEDRLIDIDIILYGDRIESLSSLKIPHPHFHNRKFVLAPMNEITPNRVHPIFNKTINELLNLCLDSIQIRQLG